MAQEQINEDIKWLESQLEAKKKELSEKSPEQSAERDVLRDVIKEVPSISAPTAPAALNDDAVSQAAGNMEEKQHEEVIQNLIEIAFSKDLLSALKVAESLKNPHILDEFHDKLADEYYQKLLDARKLK